MINVDSTTTTRDLARAFVQLLPYDPQERHDSPERIGCGINPDHTYQLALDLQNFIAEAISILIDAGSERDAVNESPELFHAIHNELKGWT